MKVTDFSFIHKPGMEDEVAEGYCPDCGKYSLVWIMGICQQYCVCMVFMCEFYEKPPRERILFYDK